MKNLRYISRTTILVVFIFQIITLQRIMRLDPDAHHDGILYGAAVSVKNGGIPNRDAFAQYGPLVPEIQGLALRLSGPSLFHIRMQALFLILIASIAIWGVARLWLSNGLALLLSTTWAFTAPTVLPWPTIYSTVLAIASLLLIVNLKHQKLRPKNINYFISGSVIAIGAFARIHLLAIFLIIFFILVFSNSHRKKCIPWFFGFSSIVTVLFFYMWINGALSSYLSQSITWPFMHYGGPKITRNYILGILWYPLISIMFFFILYIFGLMRRKSSPKILVSTLSISIFIGLLFVSRMTRVGNLSISNPKAFFVDFSNNMMNSLNYFSAFFILLVIFFILIKRKAVTTYTTLILGYGVGILTQLYPLYDVSHLWLIAPLLLICILAVGANVYLSTNGLFKGLPFLLLGLSVALILQIVFYASIPRVEFKSPSLKGMYAVPTIASELDETMLHLGKIVPPNSTVFDCLNGIYAGAGGIIFLHHPNLSIGGQFY